MPIVLRPSRTLFSASCLTLANIVLATSLVMLSYCVLSQSVANCVLTSTALGRKASLKASEFTGNSS